MLCGGVARMINKDKLRAFRDWFTRDVYNGPYDQRYVTTCLAHHAMCWDGSTDTLATPSALTSIFGVSAKVAYAMYHHPTHWQPTKNDALFMLDKLIETGKVEWPA